MFDLIFTYKEQGPDLLRLTLKLSFKGYFHLTWALEVLQLYGFVDIS